MSAPDESKEVLEASPEEEGKIEIIQLEGDGDVEEDETKSKAPKRETWGSKMAYIFTLVGYAVGFGNFWRFPYMMRENGGLAFLIPYGFMLTFVGIPTFFLELAVGQRRRKGIIYCWSDIKPSLGGLGICCGWICFMVGLYYNTLLAYCISYLADAIFYYPLPWKDCNEIAHFIPPNDPEHTKVLSECQEKMDNRASKYYWFHNTLGASNGVDVPGDFNWALAGYLVAAWSIIWAVLLNGTSSVEMVVYFTALFPYLTLVTFFIGNFVNDGYKAVLGAYRLVKPNWAVLYDPLTWLKAGSQIFFSLGLGEGCLIIFASYSPANNDCERDAISISLINCGTSLFAAMVVFPMIGAYGYRQWEDCKTHMQKVLPGLNLWTKFKDKKYDIYFTAGDLTAVNFQDVPFVEVRYGYGENSGKLKSEFDQEEYHFEETNQLNKQDFGFMPTVKALKNCSIGEAATESGGGTGFVFMGFTEAVLQMKGTNFWAIMFFTMLFTLGIDSGFGTVEGCVSAFQDITRMKRWVCTTIVVLLLTALALLLFPFGWGVLVLDLIDQWTANWTLLLIALGECIGIGWIYGLASMSYDVRLMTGKKPNMFILVCWKYVTPGIILLLLLGSIVDFIIKTSKKGIKYKVFDPKEAVKQGIFSGEVEKPYPIHSLAVGFILMIVCIMWLPLQGFLHKTKYSLVRHDGPSDFPEERLRLLRKINVQKEEDQFTPAEKKIMGKTSLQNLQEYRNERKKSEGSLMKRNSSESIV